MNKRTHWLTPGNAYGMTNLTSLTPNPEGLGFGPPLDELPDLPQGAPEPAADTKPAWFYPAVAVALFGGFFLYTNKLAKGL